MVHGLLVECDKRSPCDRAELLACPLSLASCHGGRGHVAANCPHTHTQKPTRDCRALGFFVMDASEAELLSPLLQSREVLLGDETGRR